MSELNTLNTLERKRVRASEKELRGFFTRLDRETEHLPGFHILFGHHILLLRFPDQEAAEKYRVFLNLICIDHEGEPDGTITVWQGKTEDYINLGDSGRNSFWECAGDSGFIRFVKWPDRILAQDTKNSRQYIITNDPIDRTVPFWASFHWEFHNFAMSHGYAFIHGGAVGKNGEGVLITSMGGCGKSTTVLSCLLDGFDYVSDDYLILEKDTAAAYPVYSCGILNEDSLQRLPELKPLIYGRVPDRPNRFIIDLSGYSGQFCREMIIKAVVYPRVLPADDHEQEALVRKDPLHAGKTQMIISTARQNGFGMMWDQQSRHHMFDAVSGLPSYELILSQDRQSNCRALRHLLDDLRQGK